MSSFVGHVACGTAVYLSQTPPRLRWTLFALVFAAVAPDFDYLALWLFHIRPELRVTHSLLFCFAIGVVGALILPGDRTTRTRTGAFLTLSACTHLALDLLVGVHPLPLFWPALTTGVASPIGILPSAGHLSVTNYYLWRNLLIECGVLLPVLATLVAVRRTTSLRVSKLALLLPLWLACLGWSITLPR